MTVLITGGCGFIGTNFVLNWLKSKNESLVNLDKLTYASTGVAVELSHDLYTFVKSDINNKQTITELLFRFRPHSVINFAAETHVDRSIKNPINFISTNINGTCTLLDSCLAYWASLDKDEASKFKFIQISTDEVYGSLTLEGQPFSESSQISPNSPYSASKASADLLARSYFKTYGLPVLITRCSNNFGPFQNEEKFIPKVISSAVSHVKIPIYGEGAQIRDWLFVDDHIEAILSVLESGQPGGIYNIGGGTELTNISLALKICKALDVKFDRESGHFEQLIEFVDDRPGHDFRYAINFNLIHEATGWQPKSNFNSSLRKTIDFYA